MKLVGGNYLISHQLHRPNDKCFKIRGNLEASSTLEKNFPEDGAQEIPACFCGVLAQFGSPGLHVIWFCLYMSIQQFW